MVLTIAELNWALPLPPLSAAPLFCSKLTADVTVKIADIEASLSTLAEKSNSTDVDLSALETDAKSLDRVVKELAEQLEFIKISDVRGECHTEGEKAAGWLKI